MSDQPPGKTQEALRRSLRLTMKITAVSWRDLAETLGPILLLVAIAILLAYHFIRPAPPKTITMSSGPAGSNLESIAGRYQKILARSGITLKIVQSEGSLDNLKRLADTESGIDISLVQSGVTVDGGDTADIVSLGSTFYVPLTIFYRSPHELKRLSQLRGQRIAIGREGSGTEFLALALLKANEIDGNPPTKLLNIEGEAAKTALLGKQADAIFLSGDSAGPATIRAMLHADGIRLFDFPQADAYARRFPYLNKLVLPPGAFDLGENLPPTSINMLAPTVELLTHVNLHPALCDLLIEAAFEVHGRASLLTTAGQFPAPLASVYPISDEATRYYKSGNKSLLYQHLPFWLASLLNRALVIVVPILVVLIPGLRFLPQLYGWRINSRIHRRYGELMAVEREALSEVSEERRAVLLERLDEIEKSVIATKMPGSHADQLYVLRQHLRFVKDNLLPTADHAVQPPPPQARPDGRIP